MCQNFLSFYEWVIFHCMDLPHYVCHSSIDGHWGCFHFWATVINAVMKTCVQGFVWTSIFTYLGCISRSGIAGSFPDGSDGKESACNAGDLGSVPGSWRYLGEGNGNASSILAWRIRWTEESGRLHSPWGCKESDTTEWLTLWTFDCSKCLLNMVIWC